MTAEEYIVARLLKLERDLYDAQNKLKETEAKLYLAEDQLKTFEHNTIKTANLLNELKHYCMISVKDNLKCIKIIYNDEQYDAKRIVAFDDERIYNILLELLGPLTEEVTE